MGQFNHRSDLSDQFQFDMTVDGIDDDPLDQVTDNLDGF